MNTDYRMFLWYCGHADLAILYNYRIYKLPNGMYEVCTKEYFENRHNNKEGITNNE